MSDSKPRVLLIFEGGDPTKDRWSPMGQEFSLQKATHYEMGLFMAKQWEPHLCLVEGTDSLIRLCFSLRDQFSAHQMGLIVYTHDPSWTREERAFRAGCDHLLPGSAEWRRLRLRIHSVLHRLTMSPVRAVSSLDPVDSQPPEPRTVSLLGLEISPKDYLVRRAETRLSVSPTQFRLLMAFLERPDQLLSREWLREHVWDNAEISSRSIDAQVSKLKKILPELDSNLINIYGKGYILNLPRLERIAS